MEKQLTRNSQAKPSCISPQSRKLRHVRFPANARVQNSRQSSDITDGPCQRPGAIESRRQRDNTLTRNAPPRWLQTDDAAQRGGDAGRATRVCAHTPLAHPPPATPPTTSPP